MKHLAVERHLNHNMPGEGMRIAVHAEGPATITLALAGKVNGASLGELRREIERARRMQKQVAIDLSEVTLMDRPSLEFLASQWVEDVSMVNCPEYIEPWFHRELIARERAFR